MIRIFRFLSQLGSLLVTGVFTSVWIALLRILILDRALGVLGLIFLGLPLAGFAPLFAFMLLVQCRCCSEAFFEIFTKED